MSGISLPNGVMVQVCSYVRVLFASPYRPKAWIIGIPTSTRFIKHLLSLKNVCLSNSSGVGSFRDLARIAINDGHYYTFLDAQTSSQSIFIFAHIKKSSPFRFGTTFQTCGPTITKIILQASPPSHQPCKKPSRKKQRPTSKCLAIPDPCSAKASPLRRKKQHPSR